MSFKAYELPVSLELMELSLCGCRTSISHSVTMRYKCIKNQLMYTDLCKFVSCKNDGAEFDVTVHDDSNEVQLLLSCLLIILYINNCCVTCRLLYFESMKYFIKSNTSITCKFWSKINRFCILDISRDTQRRLKIRKQKVTDKLKFDNL